MKSGPSRKQLAGSKRAGLIGARDAGAVNENELIEVTLQLRPRMSPGKTYKHAMSIGEQFPCHRQYLSRDDFALLRGANPEDFAQVAAFAHKRGLTVAESSMVQ